MNEEVPAPRPIPWSALAWLFGLYLLVMLPWFARNLVVAGAILPGGGTKTIWLTTYNDFFSYQKDLSPQSYLAWGAGHILLSKLQALGQNAFAIAAILEFAPLPFAALGLWKLRRSRLSLPFLLYLVLLYLGLSLVFTFPSLRGTLLHSFIPLLPFLSLATIAGIDSVIAWVARRRPNPAAEKRAAERRRVYLAGLILLSGILSAFIIGFNARTWDTTYHLYQQAGQIALQSYLAASASGQTNRQSVTQDALPIVMVADPPDYYMATGQHAIAIPDQETAVILRAADRYGATFLLLEALHSPAQDALWAHHEHPPRLSLIWSTASAQLYRILPEQQTTRLSPLLAVRFRGVACIFPSLIGHPARCSARM